MFHLGTIAVYVRLVYKNYILYIDLLKLGGINLRK